MQIYLHSRHNKRKRAKVGIIILSTAIALSGIFLIFSAFSDTKESSFTLPQKPVYLSYTTPTQSEQSIDTAVSEECEAQKMNNSESENANLYQNSNSSVQFRLKEIILADKNGVCRKLPLEEYVLGCLLAEMPLDFHPQALMAQAVAARTYAAEKILCGTSKHKNADLCTSSSCCQSYCDIGEKSYSGELLQKAKDAVNATKGMIAIYDRKPINAVYHASSGYCTLDSSSVWGGNVPYLKSVKSPQGEEDITNRQYTYSNGAFCRILKGSTDNNTVTVFASRDSYFGDSVEIDNVTYSPEKVAKAFNLKNSHITLKSDGKSITVVAGGYGHRVGMSQHGANLLAKEGKSCTEILSYYYTGISFAFLSD